MLSQEALERLSERLVLRAESLNSYMLKKLANQIVDIGELMPSQLHQVLQSVKYANDLDEIITTIASMTDRNVKDIYDIFEEVAKYNQEYAKQFYEYKNIKYIPYDKNKELQNYVKSIADITASEYVNMSSTMAFAKVNDKGIKEFTNLSDIYQQVTDEAIMSITQGRESYEMVKKRMLKELTDSGIRTVDYDNGYSRRLDSSVRMNIMDGIRQLNMDLQERFGNEYGADGVEVSHHINSAPDHIDTIDGQQFSKQEFEDINNSLERHVGELNCYHFTFQIVLGVSEPMYSKEQLEADKMANKEGFEFEGNKYTNYEGTQLQRQIETKIRQYKDKQIVAKINNDNEEVLKCDEKITQLSSKYNELSKVSGLPNKVERLRIDGYIPKTQNIINYVDVTKEWIDNATPGIGEISNTKSIVIDNYEYISNKEINGKLKNKINPDKNERNTAIWLKDTFGGNIEYLPKINEVDGIKCADYLYNGERWDLKTLTVEGKSEQLIYHNIYGKEKQSHNFIIDGTKSTFSYDVLIEQCKKLYSRKDLKFLEKIILKKDDKYIILNSNKKE